MMLSNLPPLATRLLACGIPVVVCTARPGWRVGDAASDLIPPTGWAVITVEQARIDIKAYRPGVDTLAMVGGHGVDIGDVDFKTGADATCLPPEFKAWGMTRTPGGGWHFPIPSSGFGKGVLTVGGKVVGDYVGGKVGGGGRLLCYLPGSSRPKYAGKDYIEEQPWDLDRLLEDSTPDIVVDVLRASDLRNDQGGGGRPGATRGEAERFLASHSAVVDCTYGAKVIEGLLAEGEHARSGGRHAWLVRSMARIVGLMLGGVCLDARAYSQIEDKLADVKPEGGSSAYAALAWAIENSDSERCDYHSRASAPFNGGVATEHFWGMLPELADLRDYARGHLVDPMLLFGAVSGIISACVRGNQMAISSGVGAPAPISLLIVNVGKSGAGKTSAMRQGFTYLGIGALDHDIVRSHQFGNPQALKDLYISEDVDPNTKERLLRIRDAQIFWSADELGALIDKVSPESFMAAMGDVRSLWSGVAVSDTNASVELRRNIPELGVGFSLFLSLLPHNCNKLLTRDQMENGSYYRYLYTPARTERVEDGWERKPPLNNWWVCAEGELYDLRYSSSQSAVVLNRLDIAWPPGVLRWVREEHIRTANAEVDADEGARKPHETLNILKLAATLAGLAQSLPNVRQEHVDAAIFFVDNISKPEADVLVAGVQGEEKRIRQSRAKHRVEDRAYEASEGARQWFLARESRARVVGRVTRREWSEKANPHKALGWSKKDVRGRWGEFVAVCEGLGWELTHEDASGNDVEVLVLR